ncbi:hypothetical protein [Bacillus cereus group sp. TH152-1LC]|uniref:hypothetical protein n=1 Tax=Bacillus cereus group sp. TH152-1LC TaxID=3018060 RepID=UPI0022E2645A|nr:hypothetical protein [Bacillus cereus group sp. TH152-1LC]MDA1675146.1 hypothetical protein [Bacillus cereus group sp. TH152-1LC]
MKRFWGLLSILIIVAIVSFLGFTYFFQNNTNSVTTSEDTKSRSNEPLDSKQEKVIIPDVNLLESFKKGELLTTLHLGKNKESLTNELGQPQKIEQKGDYVIMQYKDASFKISQSSKLNYETQISGKYVQNYSIKQVKESIGKENSSILFEEGTNNGKHYLTYTSPSGDQNILFESIDGTRVDYITFSYISVSGSN